ncbi:hypothetical protein [Brachybacterium alimentarium]|uniref:Uncharacterized protein n=1 Tax=Brachybacterium alimentarium TaxID=47845 RepID=A0A2A3YI10_9MICO|nr:hypothetical protein [Brachybacterium alimentarium]PCC38996.1 hypothetical protein CIK66_11690 [Brachybacterium alimentarium]RCS76517.1 hypothetical protein CIK70_15365 [Brachybacterium alimentarium]
MNAEPHPHDPQQQRPPDPSPTPERPEVSAVMAPEAIQAADVDRDQQAELDTEKPTRGVDWVRPSDLMARAGGALSRRGIDFQADLALRARTGIATGAKHLAASAKRLPPLSAFGRDEPAIESRGLGRE